VNVHRFSQILSDFHRSATLLFFANGQWPKSNCKLPQATFQPYKQGASAKMQAPMAQILFRKVVNIPIFPYFTIPGNLISTHHLHQNNR